MPLINQNIKVLRKQMGLTQEKFAELLGIKRSLIGAYEESRAVPPAENLSKLSELFGVSLDQLLNHQFENDLVKKETFAASRSFENEYTRKNIEPKVVESNAGRFSQADLFMNKPNEPLKPLENVKVRYVSKNEHSQYLQNFKSEAFLGQLPVIAVPFLPKGYLRAFEAPSEFPMQDSVLIVERVENYNLLKNGENHLVISKQKGLLYRRLYNELHIKGVFLASSDLRLPSIEIPESDILEIWLVKSFFSRTLPAPPIMLDSVKDKLRSLSDEINMLHERQARQ